MPDAVPIEDIKAIISSGLLAPKASNRQHWRIVVITKPDTIRQLHEKVGAQDIVYSPPVVLTVLYNPVFNASRAAHIQSCSAAVQNILLKATDMGYGTTWVAGMGDDKELRSLLSIPDTWVPLCFVLLGKTLEAFPPPPPKYELEEVLFFDVFREKAIDLPDSIRPKHCTLAQIASHQKYLSRASYLGKDYDYHHALEKKRVLELVKTTLGKTSKEVVSFYAYDGTVYRCLNHLMRRHKFIDIELSAAARDFMQYKSPDSRYIVSQHGTTLAPDSIDCCICLFALEKVPEIRPVIQEAFRVLRPEGKLLIFFKNRYSFYGVIYFLVRSILGVKSLSAVFPLSSGPYEPISSRGLIRILEEEDFRVDDRQGLFLVPAEVLTFSEKIEGYLKRHRKNLNFAKVLIKPGLKIFSLLFSITDSSTNFIIGSSNFLSVRKIDRKKKKVLHITKRLGGGIGTHIVHIFQSEAFKGISHQLVTNVGESDLEKMDDLPEGAKVFDLKIGTGALLIEFTNGWKLYRQVVDEGFDILHGHGMRGGFYARILGTVIGSKVVYTPHGGNAHAKGKYWRDAAQALLEKILSRLTCMYIFESEYAMKWFSQLLGEGGPKFVVNHNGVPCQKNNELVHESLKPGTLLVGAFGRLSSAKGYDLLIHAVDILKNVHRLPVSCKIFGKGEEAASLQELIRQLGLEDQVELAGYTPNPSLEMAECTVIAHPSRLDSLPYVPLEAMQIGTPVVATRIGGLPEIISDGVNGLLADSDPVDLADKIARIYLDNDLRRSIILNGYSELEKRFSITAMSDSLNVAYSSLINDGVTPTN
jgi:glycosyltransferase involved in cell wall biosynthesis/SAM-dependent methyltransferase